MQLTGLPLAAYLETCIRQVITLPQDPITANTGRLLRNIKADRLDTAAAASISTFFEDLPGDRADTLAAGLFGHYVDGKRTAVVADNVRLLWPQLWQHVGDDARFGFGIRYGRFQASAETGPATAARELLDLVGGTEYLPEPIRTVEIDTAIDQLMVAHHGHDNFYNEVQPARRLEQLVGDEGRVPAVLSRKFVHAVTMAFLGNGYGVARGALPSYERMLGALGPDAAGRALRAFTIPEVTSILWSATGRRQWADLLDILEPKLTNSQDRALLEAVRTFTGTPDQLHLDSRIARLAEGRPVTRAPGATTSPSGAGS